MVSSLMLLAILCLYLAHILSPPVLEISKAGAGFLQGFGHLLNETTKFTFETLKDTKKEVGYLYNGVIIHAMASTSGSWCVEDMPLVPDLVVAGLQEAFPDATFKTIGVLRAAVSELGRGTKRTRQIIREMNIGVTQEGRVAIVLGRSDGDLASSCLGFQDIIIQLEWSNSLFRPLSKPNILSDPLLPAVHNSVRASLLTALEADFPDTVQLHRKQLPGPS